MAPAPVREPAVRPPARQRLRLGPSAGQAMWSPWFSYGERPATDTDIDREVEALVGAIAERGEVGRRELRRIAESRAWGPGRFRRALRKAMDDGRVRRVGRDRLTAS